MKQKEFRPGEGDRLLWELERLATASESQARDWCSGYMTGNAYHICKAKAQTYREVMELIKHRGRLP
jgi:hypothetical protein